MPRTPLQPGQHRRAYMSRGEKRLERSGIEAHPYHPVETRKGIKDELDRVTSLLVRARDERCVTCGTTEDLECSHFYSRRWLNVRFSLVNCNAMCADCNQRHNANDKPYTAYMVNRYGEDVISELFELRNRRETPSTDELRFMLIEYRAMLREMS